MPYFFLKLLPPRPTFPADITPEEMALMQAQGLYWKGIADQGKAFAVGPVMDPAGAYGIAMVEVDDQASLDAIVAADPAIQSGRGFQFLAYPMPRLIAAGRT